MKRTILLTLGLLWFAGIEAKSAHPLAHWQERCSLPSGAQGFADVTWGDGLFVAVANGRVATSSNGRDWGVHDTGLAGYVQAVAQGNGRFVAVGTSGFAISSSDGTNWNQPWPGSSGSLNLYDLAFGNGVFVAAGQAGTLLSSVDGVTWTSHVSGTPFDIFHLIYGRGLFVASCSPGTNLVSADGTNWQRQASGLAENLYALGFGGGSFLAVDNRRGVWRSSDAVNWSADGSIAGIRPPEVGWGNGHFLIAANPAPEYAGRSGPWTSSATNIAASGVAFGIGTFVLTAGTRIFQSDPLVFLEMPGPGALKLSGPAGAYSIESRGWTAGDDSWQPRANITLDVSSTSVLWSDVPVAAPGRLYRAVLQP